jgi:RNA polymerase sigma-70 factor (ECF subfamily)
MARVQAGDAAAFETLYLQMAPRVLRMLQSMARDRAAAEDLTQTVFLKVHRARHTYTADAPVEPWIFSIARRTFIDHWRSQKRSQTQLTVDGTLPEPDPQEANPQGATREDQRAMLEQLNGALQDLPPNQAQALMLLKVQGLSLAEAAAICGTSVGAMKLRAHRAYEHIRKVLGVGSPHKVAP